MFKKLKEKKIKFEWASLPSSPYRLEDVDLVKEADIINLHWVSGLLDYSSFFKNIKKPVVWTIHDMNPFSGIFHYSNDESLLSDKHFLKINYEAKRLKEKSLTRFDDLHIVSPSSWLLEESERSGAFGKFNHYCIPNSLDVDFFRPYDKEFARSVLAIPKDKTVILFISQTVENYRKGFDILDVVIKNLPLNKNIYCVAVGNTQLCMNNNSLIYLGTIDNKQLLPLIYSAADLFVLPSRQDNLPNTMLESLACGTPVIAFNVGGMRDFIKDNINGLLINEISATALLQGIVKFISNKTSFSNEKIREMAVKEFASHIQVQQYVSLYKKILGC